MLSSLSGHSQIESRYALLQLIGRWWRPYRVIPGPRDASVSFGAGRVCFRDIVERDARLLVAERVEQSHTAGYRFLRGGVTRGRKVYGAEAGNRVLVLRVIFLCRRECSAENKFASRTCPLPERQPIPHLPCSVTSAYETQ
jgi:hypothetical protein